MSASAARAPKVDRGKPLSEQDYKSLAARWITRELADSAHVRRVDDKEGATILGRNGHGNYSGQLLTASRKST
jgi:hypothetical protein